MSFERRNKCKKFKSSHSIYNKTNFLRYIAQCTRCLSLQHLLSLSRNLIAHRNKKVYSFLHYIVFDASRQSSVSWVSTDSRLHRSHTRSQRRSSLIQEIRPGGEEGPGVTAKRSTVQTWYSQRRGRSRKGPRRGLPRRHGAHKGVKHLAEEGRFLFVAVPIVNRSFIKLRLDLRALY